MITVVRNGASAIARTIDSALGQDYPNVQYLVLDGLSRDGTQKIVESYGTRIDVFASEADHGIYDAMNKGIARATGVFVLFMNCGDVFASPSALSSLMQAMTSAPLQVACGRWVRVAAANTRTICRPDLERGVFNHQALVYSRALHDRHGGYVDARGLTTADYLFFTTLRAAPDVAWHDVDATVAEIDVSGVSAGTHTFSQKHAIDYLFGRSSASRLIAVLALHPLYHRVKRLLGQVR